MKPPLEGHRLSNHKIIISFAQLFIAPPDDTKRILKVRGFPGLPHIRNLRHAMVSDPGDAPLTCHSPADR